MASLKIPLVIRQRRKKSRFKFTHRTSLLLSIHSSSLLSNFIESEFQLIVVRGDLLSLWPSHVLSRAKREPLHLFLALETTANANLLTAKNVFLVHALNGTIARTEWLTLSQHNKFNRLSIYAERCAHTFAFEALCTLKLGAVWMHLNRKKVQSRARRIGSLGKGIAGGARVDRSRTATDMKSATSYLNALLPLNVVN
jgi:hypothetical protein